MSFWIIFWTSIGVGFGLFLYFIWLIKRINDTEMPGEDEFEHIANYAGCTCNSSVSRKKLDTAETLERIKEGRR